MEFSARGARELVPVGDFDGVDVRRIGAHASELRDGVEADALEQVLPECDLIHADTPAFAPATITALSSLSVSQYWWRGEINIYREGGNFSNKFFNFLLTFPFN